MMIGVYIGQFCVTSITWFFLTWFPTYLYQAKGMSILKVGFVASIPAIAGFIGGLLGGVFSDWLLKRGYSLTVARKLPVICGMLLSCVIVIANYTSSEFVVIAAMSLAFFAKGFGNLAGAYSATPRRRKFWVLPAAYLTCAAIWQASLRRWSSA